LVVIKLSLSEAFAYDLLAIADIKTLRNVGNYQASLACADLDDEIAQQVGYNHHCAVLASDEYAALRKVNDEMYVRIDELKARGEQLGDAVYIDSRVYQRFLAKQALQKRWFPDQPLTEQKMGYGEGKA
jgi:hypothetical protein